MPKDDFPTKTTDRVFLYRRGSHRDIERVALTIIKSDEGLYSLYRQRQRPRMDTLLVADTPDYDEVRKPREVEARKLSDAGYRLV